MEWTRQVCTYWKYAVVVILGPDFFFFFWQISSWEDVITKEQKLGFIDGYISKILDIGPY